MVTFTRLRSPWPAIAVPALLVALVVTNTRNAWIGAFLAICSDLDLTPDAETYYECARFLNTTASTPRMGEGPGR